MDSNDIIPYIEPIYRFCSHRLQSRYDAEDLASEIICHILTGMEKYDIKSMDAWVWRIAHNRYARFIDKRNRNLMLMSDIDPCDAENDDYCFIDEESTEHQYEDVFRYLHTLSAEYRNILVDYYIGECPVKVISGKFALPETTVKWRLNIGRQKIRERIGENKMEKIFGRINWNTTCCNGSMDSDKYLHTQISRAICEAAYEKPLTVEEISLATGIPSMYIEDELPRLEYGDAVQKIGNKYATDFIILHLKDRKTIEDVSSSVVSGIADVFQKTIQNAENKIKAMTFYGHESGINKLGYIAIPYLIRKMIHTIKDKHGLVSGSYPPRKDGGYGWFIVEQTLDANENCAEYSSGCNTAGDDSGSGNGILSHIYYYWISKYFNPDVYHDRGTRWLCANGIPQKAADGLIRQGTLSEDDTVRLLQNYLTVKKNDKLYINFACFTQEQFEEFISAFSLEGEHVDILLDDWVLSVRRSFENFVPKRLHGQINQWLSGYVGQIIGYVTDELIRRGILEKPDTEKPLVNGVFYVEGKYINP